MTHDELRAFGKSRVFTGEPRDWKVWSSIFEAYSEAGCTQLAQGLKRVTDWWSGTVSCTVVRDRQVLTAICLLHVVHTHNRKSFSYVQLAEPGTGLAGWQQLVGEHVTGCFWKHFTSFLHERGHGSCGRSRPALLHALAFSALQTTSEFLHSEPVAQQDASIGKLAQAQTPTAQLGWNPIM